MKIISNKKYKELNEIEEKYKKLLNEKNTRQEYKFYKVENNEYGSDYCFFQDYDDDDNMYVMCFLENGELLGFMSESLTSHFDNIKEIDLFTFMHEFVRPLIKKANNKE